MPCPIIRFVLLAAAVLALACIGPSHAAFTDALAPLTGVSMGDISWGDLDNNGLLDLVVTGFTGTQDVFRTYVNDSGVLSDTGTSTIAGTHNTSIAWADYDRDGRLDLALAGSRTSAILDICHNDSGLLYKVSTSLDGIGASAVDWGDFDNDGDPDLAVAGSTSSPFIRIYRNDGAGVFTDINAGLPQLVGGSVAWGDYDRDGDLDLAIQGRISGGAPMTRIYRNDGGVFSDIGAPLLGLYSGDLAWGDYDSDGDLDLAVAGTTASPLAFYTKIYRNDNGAFVDISAALAGMYTGELAWGDVDSDGDLDLAVAGSMIGNARVYLKVGGDAFADMGAGLAYVYDCGLDLGDYDSDGDLDIALCGSASSTERISKVYRNVDCIDNAPPTTPTLLSASVSEDTVTFRWSPAIDDHTPANGLSYNLRVGTTPGADDVFSAMADLSTGRRRLPAMGNAQKCLSWTLKGLHPESQIYYWSVQAIDTAWIGGPWAAEQMSIDVNSLKGKPDSTPVRIGAAVITQYSTDAFYIESDDRTAGIRVEKPAHGLHAGMRTNVFGTLTTNSDGERCIAASSAVANGSGAVEPIALRSGSAGGGDLLDYWQTGVGQRGMKGAVGLNNIGLLVRIWGKVTYRGSGYFYLDDGSNCNDLSGHLGIRVLSASSPALNSLVQVTGVSSCFKTMIDGAHFDLLRLIRATDVAPITAP